MSKIVIFGVGDIASLAHLYFRTDSEHDVVAFTVDRDYLKSEEFEGLPAVAAEEVVKRYPPSDFKMFLAISYAKMNRVRAAKYAHFKGLGYELVSYVSSRCSNLTQYPIGDNCFILEDNTIQPFVRIGSNVTLWSGNHIGHHSTIGDHCFISSHVVVSGRVVIQNNCFIGVNATLRNAITIAPETLIGAGAIIMKDTVEKGVYVPKRTEIFSKKSDEIEL
jgi:sugar O-acyltransferase (sialic acid O-acetyltransferase NeuD family)